MCVVCSVDIDGICVDSANKICNKMNNRCVFRYELYRDRERVREGVRVEREKFPWTLSTGGDFCFDTIMSTQPNTLPQRNAEIMNYYWDFRRSAYVA